MSQPNCAGMAVSVLAKCVDFKEQLSRNKEYLNNRTSGFKQIRNRLTTEQRI